MNAHSKMPTHLMGHSYFEKQIIKCHIMVGKNTLKSLVLLLQADLILIIPEKHFHILSLQIEKKKKERKSERYFPLLLQESLLGVSVWENERCSGNGW